MIVPKFFLGEGGNNQEKTMKKVALILLSMVLANFAFADGHGHGNEFPFKYFLHNDITTDDAQGSLAGTRAFV